MRIPFFEKLLFSLLPLFLAACAHQDESTSTGGYDRTLSLQGISFLIEPAYGGYQNRLRVSPDGLASDNSRTETAIDGIVTGADVADLNSDGSPELYVYITSAGSGSYGSIVAYATNDKQSMSPIDIPILSADRKNSEGYMGHDEFAVVENALVRRFPVYNDGDSNAKPTGGMRQLHYRLEGDEASWFLRLADK